MTTRLAIASFVAFALASASWADDVASKIKPAAKEAPPDIVISGQILKEDAPDRIRNLPSKVHALRLQKDKVYVVDLIGEGIIPFVHLEDSTGNLLSQGMNRVNNMSRLRFAAPKEDIFLFYVVSLGGNEGKYTLTVKPFVAAAVKLIPLATPALNKPTEIKGQLNADDPPDQFRDFPSKVHTIDLKKGKTYVIDMMSGQFDTYLMLQTANAVIIAQDDDGGGNLNSRIRYQSPGDASFRIVATTFNGQVGPFTLRVTEQP
jgi:hypothetical protein